MAVIKVTNIHNGPGYDVFEWADMLAADVGEPIKFPINSDKSITVVGTNGTGGAVSVQGSNTPFGTDWCPLRDPSGTLIAAVNSECRQVLENTVRIRPSVVGDGSTIYTVRALVKATT